MSIVFIVDVVPIAGVDGVTNVRGGRVVNDHVILSVDYVELDVGVL